MTARLSLAASVLALTLLMPAGPARAAIVFVNGTAPGGDGTSWANAYTDLRTALTAPTTMAGDEIWVAAGIYTPGATSTLSFPLKNGVALYGGFTGTETARGQRDPTTNVTMLSGEIGDGDTSADNSEHVVRADATVLSAVVDGVMIAMGYATTAPAQGGGLLNEGGSLTLANCTFAANQAVGAVGTVGTVGGPGGSASGGAIHSTGGTLTITNCRFVANFATGGAGGNTNDFSVGSGGPGGAATGGAIHAENATVAVTLSTFSANQATGGGGGFAITFGGAGGSGKGGGIGQTSGTLTVSATRFLGNSATGGGGGGTIATPGSGEGGGLQTTGTATVTNAVFSGNTAMGAFGTTFSGSALGGGVSAGAATLTITNSTFSRNSASSGIPPLGGPASGGGLRVTMAATVTNSLFWGNAAQTGPQIDGPAVVSFSDVQGGFAGTANIAADPLFVDDDGADDLVGTDDDDLRLRPGSPAADAGSNDVCPATDLTGVGRPVDGDDNGTAVCDMGAHELVLFGTLTVVTAGPGTGTVTAAGIACGTDCVETYPVGTLVTLVAVPGPGSVPAGLTGTGCTGATPCPLTIHGDTTITATFSPPFQGTVGLTASRSTVGPGEPVAFDLLVANPTGAAVIDAFFGILPPAGVGAAFGCPADDLVAFVAAGGIALRCLSQSPATFPPLVRQATVPAGLPATTLPAFFVLTLPPGSPPGIYTIFLVLGPAYGFADGVVDASDIPAVAVLRVTLL